MATPLTVRPRFTVLEDRHIRKIHVESLKILSSVGIRVESKQALEMFAKAMGASVVDNDVVRIPPDWVDWALAAAPSSMDIYDRGGDLAFRLPGPTRFGIGVTVLYYLDPETGRPQPFGRRHMQTCVRMGNALPSFDTVSTVGVVQDVPVEVTDLYATLEMTANTTKPLVVLISGDNALPDVLDMLEELHGDLKAKPFIIPYFNPVTPLVLNRGTVDKMRWTIERGLPFVFSNAGLAGATTPITPGGTLTLMNAELLAGLVLSQLMREGAPIILGILPSVMDMHSTGPIADARRPLLDTACAEMMAHYGIPHYGTAGGSGGWGADLQASGQQWLNHVFSCLGNGGLATFVGSLFAGMAFSPQLSVYANEVIAQARRFARGFSLDDADAVFDDIVAAGPGGHFLSSDLTLAHFRESVCRSEIFPHLNLSAWQAAGHPRSEDVLTRHTVELIAGLKAPADHDELMQRGEAFIRKTDRSGSI